VINKTVARMKQSVDFRKRHQPEQQTVSRYFEYGFNVLNYIAIGVLLCSTPFNPHVYIMHNTQTLAYHMLLDINPLLTFGNCAFPVPAPPPTNRGVHGNGNFPFPWYSHGIPMVFPWDSHGNGSSFGLLIGNGNGNSSNGNGHSIFCR